MEGKVKLIGEQAKDLTDTVEKQALERIRSRALISEADYYAGAAVTIQYLTEDSDSNTLSSIIPPMWVFGIMSGRSPSTRWEEDGLVRGQLDSKLERQSRLYQNAELMYEFVSDVFDPDRYTGLGYTPSQILNEIRVHARLMLEDIGLYDFWPEEDE